MKRCMPCIPHHGATGIMGNLAVFLVLVGCLCVTSVDDAAAREIPKISSPTADHGKFDVLNNPMATGPDVTKTCLSCHTEAGGQMMESIHWTWGKEMGEKGWMGKAHTLNSF